MEGVAWGLICDLLVGVVRGVAAVLGGPGLLFGADAFVGLLLVSD